MTATPSASTARRCGIRKAEREKVGDDLREVLEVYRKTPGTTGRIRRQDRLVATRLHQRGVPLLAVENALVLAAARRLARPAGAPPLGTIRSLAYFLPVIDEVLDLDASQAYFEYLRSKLERSYPNRSNVPVGL